VAGLDVHLDPSSGSLAAHRHEEGTQDVADGRRVLVTGAAGQIAGLLVHALDQREDVARIVGVDVSEPAYDIGACATSERRSATRWSPRC
jgi:hypothetical protein